MDWTRVESEVVSMWRSALCYVVMCANGSQLWIVNSGPILLGPRLTICLILNIGMDGAILLLEGMRMIDWAAMRWSLLPRAAQAARV